MIPTKLQQEVIDKLKTRDKVVLEMDCRMGKSFIALRALQGTPITVICPPALLENWEDECRKAGIKAKVLKTTEKSAFKFIPAENAIIVDEAHEQNKWKTSQEMFRRIRKAKRTFFLTATSLINKPIDLYWFLKLCNVYKGNLQDFAVRYNGARIGRFNQLILGEPRHVDELISLKKQCFLSYKRDLKIEKEVISLGRSTTGVDNFIQNYSIIQSLIALEKGRNEMTEILIDQLKDQHKKMLFLYFHKSIREKFCQGRNKEIYIDGTVPIKKRYQIIEKYKRAPMGYLWLNYKSCGRGLDIAPTDAVVFVEQTFSPALDYQAFMRAYGFQREKPLKIYYLVYDDEQRMIVSERKKKQTTGLMRY